MKQGLNAGNVVGKWYQEVSEWGGWNRGWNTLSRWQLCAVGPLSPWTSSGEYVKHIRNIIQRGKTGIVIHQLPNLLGWGFSLEPLTLLHSQTTPSCLGRSLESEQLRSPGRVNGCCEALWRAAHYSSSWNTGGTAGMWHREKECCHTPQV